MCVHADPHHWEAAHVVAWIKLVKKESKNSQYLAKVKADRYKSFKGQVLCNLRKDIFLAFEPGVAGEVLYKDLHKRVQCELCVCELCVCVVRACVCVCVCVCVCMHACMSMYVTDHLHITLTVEIIILKY